MVDMEVLEKTIEDAVNSNNGIKSVDLALQVMRLLAPMTYSTKDFLRICDRLVDERRILEFVYVISGVTGQKSIYFPKGTTIVSHWNMDDGAWK